MALTYTWDTVFNGVPAEGAHPADGNNAIRILKAAMDERLTREMYFGENDTTANHALHGRLREGAARAFIQDAAPTLSTDGNALDIYDEGRLWFESDDQNVLRIWDGSAWARVVRDWVRFCYQGPLVVADNVSPVILFPRVCTVNYVAAIVKTASTVKDIQLDLNNTSSGSIFTDETPAYMVIPAGQTTVAVLSSFHTANKEIPAGSGLTIDINQVGTVPGSDLTIVVEVLVGAA